MAAETPPEAMPLGRVARERLRDQQQEESRRLAAVISAQSHGLSLAVFLAAVLLAAILVVRRVWALDLVSVLKTRE